MSVNHSWVTSANGHADFPLHNLPLGIFSHGQQAPRSGVAIGEQIFDLQAARQAGLFHGLALEAVEASLDGSLNGLFALGKAHRVALRERLLELLSAAATPRPELLHLASDCQLHVPAKIGDYTDFYVGINHAENVGKLFRPDNPLLPNYKHVPIGYHGRASTIRASGAPVRRPNGQTLAAGATEPTFGPSQRLDYELELGIWMGPGNPLGEAIAIGQAGEHIAGYCLLNDWSARDIQAWEYQPLGPFLAKNFITTISPWVVTAEALEPFRCAQAPRPAGDPQPLAYLLDAADQAHGALDIELEVLLLTPGLREQGLPPERLTLSNSQSMYWTPAQLIAHHSVNGCQLQPGDLFGTGTLSGAQPGQFGSLLEISQGGKHPLSLASGETRRFLEDGDEIILRARCSRPGFASIGFGECRGQILPAPAGL
ncbi:fumarylacetoacetase [Pseudomonas sp. 5P_3.1_Bac2]|uniref:fumarylacetoacetase n=1 Tax=Pseudomonas sp. 5P_3.1_Bac2 TaxID=2971617 RepID=UPI0021C76AB0|nr:fumarylacetoacetase [Pseudomonas sp. 5P_3.1_Bac2]MCU1717184.1 fumarylacetoacetase [Pseudomonas sp. 5P_3.1_Bac2]